MDVLEFQAYHPIRVFKRFVIAAPAGACAQTGVGDGLCTQVVALINNSSAPHNQGTNQRASKACLRLRSACSSPSPAATTSAMPHQANTLGTSPHIQYPSTKAISKPL